MREAPAFGSGELQDVSPTAKQATLGQLLSNWNTVWKLKPRPPIAKGSAKNYLTANERQWTRIRKELKKAFALIRG